MKVKVTGFNPVKFEKDGKNIEGVKLHYIYADRANDHLIGQAAENSWVNKMVADGLNLKGLLEAPLCELEFNKNGKIVDIFPVGAGR
ncbi:MAG: hypothetical protein CVU00_15225 [Bacteroidetes bacterium HGW-Bacteroidetes-17]|nr:MAG: hypothetical protein CVU00_15225 [Bacteroidetes bacterium HGW-Bacteroidetes-17]